MSRTTAFVIALISLLLIPLGIPETALADDDEPYVRFYGPLRIRDLQPLGLIFMDFVPSHAVEGVPGVLYFEAGLSHANTFIKSENVRDYLIERPGPRRALSAQDYENILAFEEDAFYFDGAAGYANFTFHYSISRDWHAYLQIPYIYYNDGFMDATIEGFHDTFGFGQAQRDLVERDRTQVLLKLGDDTFQIRDGPGNDGLGDPVFGVSRAFRRPSDAVIVVEAAVKVPVAEEERFLSSGATDVGAQVSFHKQWDSWGIYSAFSYVLVGDPDTTLPTIEIADVYKGSGAIEKLLGDRWSAVFQGSLRRSPFQDTDSQLSDLQIQLSLGVRWAFQRTGALEFAVTENLSNFNSTPDIGFHLSTGFPLVRLFGRGGD